MTDGSFNRATPKIIPAIDLIEGKIVRLYQGDYHQETCYGNDPLQKLLEYVKQGAEYLHLVDLTGAKNPNQRQTALIKTLVQNTKAHIQVGGGIRSEAQVVELLEAGVSKVVIGSMAVKDSAAVKRWFRTYGAERFVLALDVHICQDKNLGQKNTVAIHGWQEYSGVLLEAIIEEYLAVGLIHVLCTDIAKDGTLLGTNIQLYSELVERYPVLCVQASGGIGSLDDVKAIKNVGVAGVIVGRALLEGKVTLEEAIRC